MIQRSPLGKVLGRERMHFSLELAVRKYLASPDPLPNSIATARASSAED
jgi:hypothetical protein